MGKAKDELKNWVPKRGKKMGGVPEIFGFTLVAAFAVVLVICAYWLLAAH